jgi:hypothetical protein
MTGRILTLVKFMLMAVALGFGRSYLKIEMYAKSL